MTVSTSSASRGARRRAPMRRAPPGAGQWNWVINEARRCNTAIGLLGGLGNGICLAEVGNHWLGTSLDQAGEIISIANLHLPTCWTGEAARWREQLGQVSEHMDKARKTFGQQNLCISGEKGHGRPNAQHDGPSRTAKRPHILRRRQLPCYGGDRPVTWPDRGRKRK